MHPPFTLKRLIFPILSTVEMLRVLFQYLCLASIRDGLHLQFIDQ